MSEDQGDVVSITFFRHCLLNQEGADLSEIYGYEIRHGQTVRAYAPFPSFRLLRKALCPENLDAFLREHHGPDSPVDFYTPAHGRGVRLGCEWVSLEPAPLDETAVGPDIPEGPWR